MIEKRNYIQGDYEEITEQAIGTFVLNTWTYIKLDNYFKFMFSDPVVKVASTSAVIPATDYELLTDTTHTALEAESAGSSKTLYAQLKITNATYAGVELALDCNNFGTYTDNEAVDSLFVGFIGPFASPTAPRGWAECDGSAISRTTYARLFAVIGTTWGVGDGSTTFNLPDLRGVFLRGAGVSGTLDDADGDAFDGGSVGDTANDKMQQITGQVYGRVGDSYSNDILLSPSGAFSLGTPAASDVNTYDDNSTQDNAMQLKFDSADSPNARTGAETQPANASILYCIKY